MRRLAVVVLLAGLALLGLATPAFAHNTLLGSDPGDRATVQRSPTTIKLTYDEPVQEGKGFNTIKLTGPNGTTWRTGAVKVDSTVVSSSVGPLGPAGDYRIAWRIVSADGHPVSGELTFTLANAGTGKPVDTSSGSGSGADSGSGGVPIWAWLLGAVVLLGVGLTVALRIGGKEQ